jgi:DNA-binding IclR family transcriptional regulator
MQLLNRFVAIMDAISAQPESLGLADVAKATALAPATAHRLLSALQEAHMIERDPETRRYRPGVAMLRLAGALGQAGFDSAADRGLRALRDRWQESFFLAALRDDVIFSVRSVSTIIGAYATDAERERLLGRADALREYTAFTITDRAALERELDACRERGYAVCDQETEIGVAAFAVPVISADGGSTGRSVAVIGPRERVLQARDAGLLDDMRSAALFLGAVATSPVPEATPEGVPS